MLGCTEPKTEETAPILPCPNVLIIESVNEKFCNAQLSDFKSNLETSNGLYIQYLERFTYQYASSDNYEFYNIAFANIVPDSSDWESEAAFFERLIKLLRPETKHRLDITELGGFAIELWDLDGAYYSTEFGTQETGTFIEPRRITFTYEGPTYNQVINYLEVHLVSTKPIIVWNQSGSKSLTVDTNHLGYIISFIQFGG